MMIGQDAYNELIGEERATGRVSLDHRIGLFYLLEELHAAVQDKALVFDPRQARLLHDVARAREEANDHLLSLFFDYLAVVCIGEGRHAPSRCSKPFSLETDTMEITTTAYESRETAYKKVVESAGEINPHLALAWLVGAFNGRKWEKGYGGEKWAQIAKIALLRFSVPAPVFIDTVVNLQHNTGSCLNKPFLLSYTSRLRSLLNWKARRRASFFSSTLPVSVPVFLSYEYNNLVERALGLGFVEELSPSIFVIKAYENEHKPMTWGTGAVHLHEQGRRRRRR